MNPSSFFTGMTKVAAKKKAQSILASHPLFEEFEDQWLSDLYLQNHYGCKKYQLRPEKFKKTNNTEYGGKSFNIDCYFSAIGWKSASYRLCFENKTWKARTITALRLVARDFMADYLLCHSACGECGNKAEEVDHVNPEFSEIVSRALGLFPESYWQSLHDETHDWMNEGSYQLPADNPAVYYVSWCHRDDVIEVRSLCKPCHSLKTNRKEIA